MENKVLFFERDNVREIRTLGLSNATTATPRRGSLLYKVKSLACAVLAMAASATALRAGEMSVKMLPSENWWGLCNNFGSSMPFNEDAKFACDLRKNNYAHQSLSFLCSDKGRAMRCLGGCCSMREAA